MEIKIHTHWNQYLELIPLENRDIYFSEEYVRLYESETQKAFCCCVMDGENVMLFPFLSRKFEFEGQTLYDFETVYGYGGPIWNQTNKEFMENALKLMVEELKRQHYVAGFVRFHPLLQNQGSFECIGHLFAERKTVAINLDQTIDKVWSNEIHSKNRNVIRKAEKAGCCFIVDNQYEHLVDFIHLYNSTMNKLSADNFYYFDNNYYKLLTKGIPDSFLGYVIDANGKLISAAIFMYSGIYGHYHLSGSDKESLNLSPNNFMLWEAAKEFHKRGVKYFHLGGGTTNSDDNSLFLFKQRFSKDVRQFYIGKIVINQDMYKNICMDWEKKNPDKVEKYRHHLLKYKY